MAKYEARLTFKGRILLFALSTSVVQFFISKVLKKKLSEFINEVTKGQRVSDLGLPKQEDGR